MHKDTEAFTQRLIELNKGIVRVRNAKKAGRYDESQQSLAQLKRDFEESEALLGSLAKKPNSSLVYKLKKDYVRLRTCLEETEEIPCAEPVHVEDVVDELLVAEAYNEEEEKAKAFSSYKRDLTSVNEMMKEFALSVEAAQPALDKVEANVETSDRQVKKATTELYEASKLQSSRLSWMIGGGLGIVGGTIGIIGGPVGIGLGNSQTGLALGGFVGKSLGSTIETHEKNKLETLKPEAKPQV